MCSGEELGQAQPSWEPKLDVGTPDINMPGAISQETVPGCSSGFVAPSYPHSQGRLGTRGPAPPLLASVSQSGARSGSGLLSPPFPSVGKPDCGLGEAATSHLAPSASCS